jgi:hypothetical protein
MIYQLPYETIIRPNTWSEEHFVQVMIEHYRQRLEDSPAQKLTKQALKYYEGRIKNGVRTYECVGCGG